MSAMPEDLWKRKRLVLQRRYTTIQEFAAVLIQLVHHRDADGRDIGFDYGYIHAAILRKFPFVKSVGPHRGLPTKMPYKELWEISCELNRNGVKLPFRPRRKSRKRTAKKNQQS